MRSNLSAAQLATQELREAILSGELLPGVRLVQEQFAEALGLSRVPIREALRALEAEGLVTHVRGAGYSVAKVDVETLHRIQRVRRLLEADAVRQSAEEGHLGKELAQKLAERHRALLRLPPERASEMASSFRGFHFCLFESSENPILLRILRNLWDATDSWRTIYYRAVFASDAPHRRAVFAKQEKLIAAISRGDAEGTIKLLDNVRDDGIASVEQAVRTLKEENQWQARLMLQALES